MPRRLDFKLILSLTVLIVGISCVSGFLNWHMQKNQLVETMVLGADQLSRSITSATWHAMLDDDRKAAYEIMRVIADKHGVDRIRMFNREGRLAFSTDANEQPNLVSPSDGVCVGCHGAGPVRTKPAMYSRVRYGTSPTAVKTLNIVTPIYNEPSCSNASCHAHRSEHPGARHPGRRAEIGPSAEADSDDHAANDPVHPSRGRHRCRLCDLVHPALRGHAHPELIKGTQAVSAMQLDRTIEISRRSQELDELVDSFNRMRERLKIAVDELNEMQQTWKAKWPNARRNCKWRTANCSRTTVSPHWDSLPPAWPTRSITPSPAYSTCPCYWNA